MNSAEQRVENQVQFWSLLGPFLFLISIGILLFKLSTHWYFPLSAIIGIPLCVKWKLKGMAAAIGCLLVLSLISYQDLNLGERYWHVGMALALTISFIILTLSLEEVEGLLGKLQRESQSRLENFLRLDDTTKKSEEAWIEEKNALNTQLMALTQDLAIAQEDKQIFYKLAQLSKDELLQIRNQYDLLQTELVYKKQQISQLNEKLEETELTLQDFIDTDAEKKIQQLMEEVRAFQQQEKVLQSQLEEAQKQLVEIQVIRGHSEDQRERLQLIEKQHLEEQANAYKEKKQLLEIQQKLEDQSSALKQEKQTLQEALTTLQRKHDQALNTELQLQEKLNASVAKIQECEAEIAALHTSQQEWKAKDLQSKQHHQQTVQQLQMTLEKYKEDLNARIEIVNQSQEQSRKLTSALDIAQTRIKALEEEIAQQQTNTELQIAQIKEELSLKAQQIHLTTKELENKANLLEKIEIEKNNLESAYVQIEQSLQQSEQQITDLKNELVALENRPIERVIDANTRSIEAMYLQLRKQFEEKSNVLDQTRRELFAVQEKELALQKILEEKELFSSSESEALLEKEYLRLGKEYENMQQQYEKEVEILAKLIDHLIVN